MAAHTLFCETVVMFQYILMCLSTVKVLLDDSIINLGTMASSRYVAPVKNRVENLLGQLTLFNQTLVKA